MHPLEKGRTSINNIENFLLNMSKHTLKTKPYKDPVVPPGSQAPKDKYPIEDTSKKAIDFTSCVITMKVSTFI